MKRGSALLLTFMIPCIAFAEDSYQPYIDELKKEIGQEEPRNSTNQQPYIDSIKKKLKQEESEQSYIDELKATEPSLTRPKEREKSYLESEKEKLSTKEEGGAIQAVLEGKSELHPKKVGGINQAFGFRYGLSLSRNVVAAQEVRHFNDVYGSNYAPDLALFYEFQPFHSEWYGNLGLFFMGGISYFHGPGRFSFEIPKPDGTKFSIMSTVNFQFFSLPAVIGLNYRFNLFHVLRPYVIAGGATVGYVEMRSDPIAGSRGHTEGYYFAAGVALLLDVISKSTSWDLYSSFGIQHSYFTLDYSRFATYTGALNYNVSGIIGGFAFEY